ncbi:MAG: hypothetical protein ABR535_08095 [Pyrinomonadaceae bacterium]
MSIERKINRSYALLSILIAFLMRKFAIFQYRESEDVKTLS